MKRTIAISNEKGPVTVFRAPPNKWAARELWVFLVDNLRPGFTVELVTHADDGSAAAELIRPSGRKVTPELYASLMDGALG